MPKQIVTEDGEILAETPAYQAIQTASQVFFKTPYNHDRDAESAATALTCKDPTRTQQQFAADADINNILRKFMATGELPLIGHPSYADFPEEFDLQNQMVTAYQVEEAWNKLPAAVRNILKDPKTFSDYVEHCLEAGDIEPLRELGLAKEKAPPAAPEPPQAAKGGTPAPDTAKTDAAPAAPVK